MEVGERVESAAEGAASATATSRGSAPGPAPAVAPLRRSAPGRRKQARGQRFRARRAVLCVVLGVLALAVAAPLVAAEADAADLGKDGRALGVAETEVMTKSAAYEGWLEVETEHFRIIFEPEHTAAAREVVSFAEEVYRDVTDSLGYYPEKVPVIIRGRTAAANGFYAPFPHRINLFVTSPTGPWLGAKHRNWLRLLLTHELTHYVQFADRTGFFGVLSRVFGHGVSVFSFPFTPGWYIEGLTTVNETRFTDGGRGRNPFFEMQIKAPILEAKLWSLDQAAYGSAFAPRGRIYIAGYALTDYLIRTFGEGTYREIHREFERRPILGVGHAVERVTGTDYDEIYADMQADLIRRFADGARLSVGRRVSPERPGNWYVPVSTDEGLFAYVDTVDRRAGIYLLADGLDSPTNGGGAASAGEGASLEVTPSEGRPLEISAPEMVLPARLTDPYSFDVSADGRRIVFAISEPAPRHRAGRVSYSNIYLYDRETGKRRALSEDSRLWHPAISPDGRRIVAVQRRGSYSRLVELDIESGEWRTVYQPEQASVFTPRFGPAGERIVFTEHTRGFQDIMIYEDAEVRPLLEGGIGAEAGPAADVAPDAGAEAAAHSVQGRTRSAEFFPRFAGADSVLFSSDRDGRLSLYRYDMSSHRLRLAVEERIAAWSGIREGAEDDEKRARAGEKLDQLLKESFLSIVIKGVISGFPNIFIPPKPPREGVYRRR